MAERYGDELAEALPEVDPVAGFGVPVDRRRTDATPVRSAQAVAGRLPSFDLLNLPRPPLGRPWAYVKVAEGCDRACGFCAIPSFRGPQRSRDDRLDPRRGRRASRCGEIVLVAQDLAVLRPRPAGESATAIASSRSCEAVAARVDRVRLLYLYPSDLTDRADRRHLRHRRALLRPVAAARVPAAAAADAPLG